MARLGIYDSGVGGTSILKAIQKVHPRLAVTYFADECIMPLGEKSREYIRERVKNATQYLFENDCQLVILACNTASVASIRFLQETWVRKGNVGRHNLLGINKPLIEAMGDHYSYLKGKKGILISTSATYDSGYYQNELEAKGYYHVKAISSSDFASAIEASDEARIDASIARILKKIKMKPTDVAFVILACTHYPFALDKLKKSFGKNTEFIDPGPAVAYKLDDYLWRHPEYRLRQGSVKYVTTGDVREFAGIVKRLAGKSVNAKHVEI